MLALILTLLLISGGGATYLLRKVKHGSHVRLVSLVVIAVAMWAVVYSLGDIDRVETHNPTGDLLLLVIAVAVGVYALNCLAYLVRFLFRRYMLELDRRSWQER